MPSSGVSRHRPQEFDSSASLEAYLAQFEMLAQGRGWDHDQKAVQVATSLKGPALKVLSQMTLEEWSSHRSLVEVLEHHYGNQHQAEVF